MSSSCLFVLAAQAEANKAVIIKGKLEELCRELQKQNKSVLVRHICH
jgi:hypothetical protein